MKLRWVLSKVLSFLDRLTVRDPDVSPEKRCVSGVPRLQGAGKARGTREKSMISRENQRPILGSICCLQETPLIHKDTNTLKVKG